MEKLERIEIPDSYINGNPEDYFVYRIADDELPHYHKGDILLFCKDITDLKENDIVAAITENENRAALYKIHIRKNGERIIKGLTAKMPRKTEFKILGYLYMGFIRHREAPKKQNPFVVTKLKKVGAQ